MQSLENLSRLCPYCGEPIELLIDCTAGSRSYIEDCEVCCRPITVELTVDDGEAMVLLKDENEV